MMHIWCGKKGRLGGRFEMTTNCEYYSLRCSTRIMFRSLGYLARGAVSSRLLTTHITKSNIRNSSSFQISRLNGLSFHTKYASFTSPYSTAAHAPPPSSSSSSTPPPSKASPPPPSQDASGTPPPPPPNAPNPSAAAPGVPPGRPAPFKLPSKEQQKKLSKNLARLYLGVLLTCVGITGKALYDALMSNRDLYLEMDVDQSAILRDIVDLVATKSVADPKVIVTCGGDVQVMETMIQANMWGKHATVIFPLVSELTGVRCGTVMVDVQRIEDDWYIMSVVVDSTKGSTTSIELTESEKRYNIFDPRYNAKAVQDRMIEEEEKRREEEELMREEMERKEKARTMWTK
eukprot:TRINITY_DN1787_c0_g1_i5.p1 TRINITY_DN1787_c0_g1~~TRINITY_DN1787_c0_g1_i5.p1  ORF type:complete len:346 (-),score=58.37 TRINITY_DN1787_c0_g1_i5:75-1112(-)